MNNYSIFTSVEKKGWSLLMGLMMGVMGMTGFAAAALAADPQDYKVVVLTSYQEDVTTRFQKAFEDAHPGTRVEILWRHSADALSYLRRGGIIDIDVYWTPAPRNFITLKKEGKLAKLPKALTEFLPPSLVDADNYFAAFELAGYGIAYHPEALRSLNVAPPKDWSDLVNPLLRGRVQMPIPGRVGFAPVMIEAVLQSKGWEKGWADLAAIAANARFDRGDNVNETDDVASGRIAARMTIDFFTQPSRRNAKPDAGELAFVYPPQTAFNPAQVAISANAPHPETARRFVEFVLSRPAQEMLLSRDVRRLPVRKDLYSVHPEIKVNPFSKANLAFDDASRRDRQGLVAALFEIALVSPHKETVELFELLERAEKEKRGNAAQRSEIRRLLTAAPISEEQQKDPVLRRMFDFPDLNPGEPEPIASPKRLATEALWKEEVNQRLLKARTLLQALLSS